MVKITLPTLEQEIKDGKLLKKTGELICYINTSITSQTRWEEEFANQSEKRNTI